MTDNPGVNIGLYEGQFSAAEYVLKPYISHLAEAGQSKSPQLKYGLTSLHLSLQMRTSLLP